MYICNAFFKTFSKANTFLNSKKEGSESTSEIFLRTEKFLTLRKRIR